MTSPNGVAGVTNTVAHASRPCWRLTYTVRGEPWQRSYEVSREIEARLRLAAEVPDAVNIVAAYTEVPA
jgi:hypothetical protein